MSLRDKLREVLKVNDSPHKIAISFAIGIFIGMSPILGLHTVLGLAAAWVFRLNKFVTIIGVYVTNPWTIVPIYTFATWFGAKLMGLKDIIPDIQWNNLTFSYLVNEMKPLLLPFVFGTTFIGFLSAVIGYVVVYKAVVRSRK
jgi:uncharacterized protein (DUF2062 family)